MASSSTPSTKKAARKAVAPATKKSGSRINFTSAVTRDIAFEAHLFCSKPDCCRFTSYSTTEGKARAISEAAHIGAASPGGPRASATLTPAYLKSAANGIWLCKLCHALVDDDPMRYPEATLKGWKVSHATFVRQLVGKHFDMTLFELYARSRNTAESFAFLSFIENRRVL